MLKNSQHPIMKRPLPPSSSSRRGRSAASALLLLLRPDRARPSPASAARALKTSRKGINHHEECVPLLHKAVTYDGDGSGGLDSAEFSEFWTDGLTVPGTADDGTSLYETLLCECYYSFDLGWGCCRDYAGASSGEDPEDAEGQQRWVEISLTQFGEGDPGPWEKHYHKRFCKKVNENMKWEGIALKDVIAGWTSNTTEAPVTTTTGTTTAEEAATTEEPEPAATTTAATATVTTAAATTEGPEPVTTTEETVATDATPTSTTAAATTTTEAIATTATEPSATTTTTAAADAAATAAPDEAAEPIVLSFVGSTNGNIDADTASQEFLDEVSHAFWKVSLDVLEDMGVAKDRERHLAEGSALQYVYESRRPRRRLNSGLGDEFAVYFKSMNTNVENEGCPGEIAYAAEGTPCLRFRFTLARRPSGPLTEDLAAEFADRVASAVDGDGALFDALVELYPDTEVVGMGAPGSGAPYSDPANAQVILLNEADDAGAKEVAAAGFPVGGAAGGIAAAALVVALVAGFAFKRRRNRQRERKEQLNDSNLSEDAEANEVNADADRVEDWLDGESDDGRDRGGGEQRPRNPMSPASSLAAMGVASTVATRLTTGDTEVMLSSRTAWSKKEPVV